MTWQEGAAGKDPAALRRQVDERKILSGNSAKPLDNMQSDRPRYALRFISGKYQGGEFPLRMNREIIIGRSSDLDMVLVEEMVSRKHARIAYEDDAIVIEDLGSTNGTYLNGARLTGPTVLRPGDQVQVGNTVLEAT